jgi:hypothetical protein
LERRSGIAASFLGTGGVLGFLRGREVASCFEFWRERVMR